MGLFDLASSLAQFVWPTGGPRAVGSPLPGSTRKNAGRPLIIAHRGYSSDYPENTRLAFEKAIQAGADWVHLDVQLTADGIPVVLHDADLDRTTNGTGPVARATLAEIRALDAGSWVSDAFRGETVPTLDEALRLCRDHVKMSLELRVGGPAPAPAAAQELARRTREVVEAILDPEMVHYTSFHPACVQAVLEENVTSSTGFLYHYPDTLRGLQFARQHGLTAYHPCFQHLGPPVVAHARSQGLTVLTYDCESVFEYLQAIHLGVDGIMTSDPRTLHETLEKMQRAPDLDDLAYPSLPLS